MTNKLKEILAQFDLPDGRYGNVGIEGQCHMSKELKEYVKRSCIEYAKSVLDIQLQDHPEILKLKLEEYAFAGWTIDLYRMQLCEVISQDEQDLTLPTS